MMGRTLTKAQRAKLDRLNADVTTTQNAVFYAAPRNDIPFRECLARWASEAQRMAYEEAASAREAFEDEMIAQGRGWRNAYGHFYAY